MRNIYYLVKLHYKAYGDESLNKRNVKGKLLFFIPIALCILTLAGLMLYALIRIAEYFVNAQLAYEFLELLFFLVQILQFVFGISMVTNTLFGSVNEDLLKLPVSGLELFSAKAIYLYLHELLFSTAIVLPTLLVYAIVFKQAAVFYLMIIPVCFFFPIFPFILTLLFSIPTMALHAFLKNKFFILLLGSIITISLSYTVYIFVLQFVLDKVFLNTGKIQFSAEVIGMIVALSTYLVPQSLLVGMLFAQEIFLNLTIILLSSFVIIFFVLFCADKWYYKAFFKEPQSARNLRKNMSRFMKKGGVFTQLVIKEFIDIFRSVNYSFQFLALAASIPVMVFFCSKLTLNIGIGNIGELILPGVTVLVIMMFITVSSSFSASTITREGSRLFNMKISPVDYKKQIAAKFTVYSVVASISVLLSCLGLLIGRYINGQLFGIILVTCTMFALGGIGNSIKRDIKNPAYKDLGGGEMVVTNNNTIVSIAVGLLISVAVGVSIIFMCFAELIAAALGSMVGASVLYAAFSIGRLFFRLDKTFTRLEI